MMLFEPAEHLGSAASQLGADSVHVWLARLDAPDATVEQLARHLSGDEQARAARFYRPRDGRHFTVARGLLRTLLGSYLRCSPADIGFGYGVHGKPRLAMASADDDLCFNVSHSRDLALFALAHGRDLGVDIEYKRQLDDAERIAERFFSEHERAALRSLPAAQRRDGFFACWSRKEAFIKATGDGLSRPLSSFDVSLRPDEPAALLRITDDCNAAASWAMVDVSPAGDYAAALVVHGHGWRLQGWRWQDPSAMAE